MIKRASRLAVAFLVLSLSLFARETACAHDAHAATQAAAAHPTGHAAHGPEVPPPAERAPCDDAASQCCDAVVSCASFAIAERISTRHAPRLFALGPSIGMSATLASTPLEVATPPPRG